VSALATGLDVLGGDDWSALHLHRRLGSIAEQEGGCTEDILSEGVGPAEERIFRERFAVRLSRTGALDSPRYPFIVAVFSKKNKLRSGALKMLRHFPRSSRFLEIKRRQSATPVWRGTRARTFRPHPGQEGEREEYGRGGVEQQQPPELRSSSSTPDPRARAAAAPMEGEVTVLDLVVARLLSTEREQGAKPRSPGLVAFGAGLAPCRGRRDPSPAPPLLPGPSPSLRWARLLPFSAGGSQNRGWARSRGGGGASSGV
jgi:hypothetical protein